LIESSCLHFAGCLKLKGKGELSALKLYRELADWWPLLSPPDDYMDEVAFFLQALDHDDALPQRTMLELGSGGGSNAFHLKTHFAMTLTDISPDMLAVSRAINPEIEHIIGDMRSIRLGRQFDVVFIHDAIDYMTTEADLRQALETAFIHCQPGGTALFVPDHVRETFEPSTDHGGSDGDGRALRYLEWQFDPDITDSTCTTHYVFMLREGDTLHVEHDEHKCGLFARADWLWWIREAGFQPERLLDSYDRDVFVARKP
jgi:SAM-dependent methyltransferase